MAVIDRIRLNGITYEIQETHPTQITTSIAQNGSNKAADAYAVYLAIENAKTTMQDIINALPQVDNTLTISGRPADAKKTGDEINSINTDITLLKMLLGNSQVGDNFPANTSLMRWLDNTLTTAGKPADAKATGDRLTAISNALNAIENSPTTTHLAEWIDPLLTTSGKPADAKVVGDKISDLEDRVSPLEILLEDDFPADTSLLEWLDTTLTESGKPANAKVVGDRLTAISNQVNAIENSPVTTHLAEWIDPFLTTGGKPADAKVVGDRISDLENRVSPLETLLEDNFPPETSLLEWLDTTLTESSQPANAKVVGDKITDLEARVSPLNTLLADNFPSDTSLLAWLDTTMTAPNKPANAAKVGEKLSEVNYTLNTIHNDISDIYAELTTIYFDLNELPVIDTLDDDQHANGKIADAGAARNLIALVNNRINNLIDNTLTISDKAADAYTTGLRISDLNYRIATLEPIRAELDAIDNSVDVLSGNVQYIQHDLNTINESLGAKANSSDLAAVYVQTDIADSKLKTVETDLQHIFEELPTKALASDVEVLKYEIDTKSDIHDVELVLVETDKAKTDIKNIESDLSSVHYQIDSQGDSIIFAGMAAELDRAALQLSSFQNRLNEKAEIVEMTNIAIDVDRNKERLNRLSEIVDVKAEASEVAKVAAELEHAKNEFSILNGIKANAVDLAGIASEIEQNKTHLNLLDKFKADVSDIMNITSETDLLSGKIVKQELSIGSLQSNIANIREAINNRISKPIVAGTNGQILSVNENGDTQWIDPVSFDDEQIKDFVTDWLDENPEATTTVADGSITIEKLSDDVKNAIENSSGVQDAIALASASLTLMVSTDDVRYTDFDTEQTAEYFNYRSKCFDDIATYTDCDDGLSFLWFTDPHWLYRKPDASITLYKLIERLKEVRRIYENTCAKFVLCGGDWLNQGDTREQAIKMVARIPNLMRTEICEQAYTIVGNHDINLHGSGVIGQQKLSQIWYDSEVGYFSFQGRNWRCFAFDSGNMSDTMDANRWDQIDWLYNELLSNNKTHLFGAIHIHHNRSDETRLELDPPQDPAITTDFYDNLTKIENAFNQRTSITLDNDNNRIYDFSVASHPNLIGTFHFMIFGHQHADMDKIDNNIPGFGTTHSISGLSLDACCIDWSNAKLHMVRFGAGNSRNFNIIPTGGYEIITGGGNYNE